MVGCMPWRRRRRRHPTTLALVAMLLITGGVACVASYTCCHIVGTHNGLGFDRGILAARGRLTFVTTLAPGPFRLALIKVERLTTGEADSVIERLTTMTTMSGGVPGLRWMFDPSRSPGFSGVGHRTLMVSGWMAALLSLIAAGIIAWIDPLGRLARLRGSGRGFDVHASAG